MLVVVFSGPDGQKPALFTNDLLWRETRGDPMKISVIIPAYNAEATLPLTLKSLARHPARCEVEIIVVDDASPDRTADCARPLADRVLVMDGNQGPSLARNEGARAATGDVYLFTDADVEFLPDTMERITSSLEANPEYGAVTGNLSVDSVSENFVGTYKNLYMHFAFKDSGPTMDVPYTSVVAVRKDAFWEAGGFVDILPNEDRMLGIALKRAGHTILFDNDIQVRHYRTYRWPEFCRIELQRARNIVLLHLETKVLRRGSMKEHVPSIFAVATSLVVVFGLLVILGFVVSPKFWVALPVAMLGFGAVMGPFFVFMLRHKGLGFALAGTLLAGVDLALCIVGAARGLTAFLLGRRLLPS